MAGRCLSLIGKGGRGELEKQKYSQIFSQAETVIKIIKIINPVMKRTVQEYIKYNYFTMLS